MNALVKLRRLGDESAMVTSQRADRLKQEVRAELASAQQSTLRRITCEYQHGILPLLGQVSSYYVKQLAPLANIAETTSFSLNTVEGEEDRCPEPGQLGELLRREGLYFVAPLEQKRTRESSVVLSHHSRCRVPFSFPKMSDRRRTAHTNR